MKYFVSTTLVLLLCLTSLLSSAQVRTFEDISRLDFRGSGAIRENKSVVGYFFYYSIGKTRKGKRTFVLRILDENLQDINTATFQQYKHTQILGGFFNGKFICIKLYEEYLNELTYMFFDTRGELVNTIVKTKAGSPGVLRAVEGGFVGYSVSSFGGGYSIQFYQNPPQGGVFQDSWMYSFKHEKLRPESTADFLCLADNLLVSLVADKPSPSSSKVDFKILGLDIATGTRVFEVPVDDQYQAQPITAFYDEGTTQINLLGLYYAPDAKIEKENGLGLFNYIISSDGSIKEKKYLSWTYEFREFMQVTNDGVVNSDRQSGYLYFHDIIRNPDGSVVAIAEQYRRTVDGVGVAVNMLSLAMGSYSSAGLTKMVIGDLIIFKFNPDFSIQSVDFMEKTKTNINLPQGYGVANIHKMSNYIKAIGGFDYLFTSLDEEEGLTSIAYLDYEKPPEGGGKEWVFSTVNFFEGELVTDRIVLGSPRDMYFRWIYPGKPGHIVLGDYNKREKKLQISLEKINY